MITLDTISHNEKVLNAFGDIATKNDFKVQICIAENANGQLITLMTDEKQNNIPLLISQLETIVKGLAEQHKAGTIKKIQPQIKLIR